jgi:hypothetical protein
MKLRAFVFSISVAAGLAFLPLQTLQAQDKPVEQIAAPANDTAEVKPALAPVQQRAATRADRLDLDTTVVTGNRELPKVLYIVPWKKAEIGELPAQPFNTLLDEVLQPVDRDVFKREVKYFHAINSADTAGKAGVDAKGAKPAPTRSATSATPQP